MGISIRRIQVLSDRVGKSTAIGHSDEVGTNLRPLFHGTATADITPNIQALIATPAQVKVASTSAADVLTSGTGAWVVQVTGLDENLDPLVENVNLNGQTAVTTTGTFYIVTKLQVIAAGSGGENAGTIWCGTGVFTGGVPATHLLDIETGTNVSAFCVIAVPTGKSFVVDQLSIFSGDTTKDLNFQFYQYSPVTGLWYEVFDVHGKQGSIILPVSAYPVLGAGSVVMLRCAVNTGTAKVTGSIAGYLK